MMIDAKQVCGGPGGTSTTSIPSPDVVHPVEPRLQVVIGDDFQASFSDGVCGLPAHLAAAHVPLWLHQRLHDVLGATARVHPIPHMTNTWQKKKQQQKPTNKSCVCPDLQTGTTMGLSLVSLKRPLSLRACSTALLAWKRFIPYREQRQKKS